MRTKDKNHIHMICNTTDNNATKILDYVEDRVKDEKQLGNQRQMAFKYSNEGKDDLYGVIYAGKPALMYAGFSPEERAAMQEFLHWLHESELGKEITSYESEPFHLSLLAQKAIAMKTGEGLM
jgi:hypothetical protein